jgi:hypothetical protein
MFKVIEVNFSKQLPWLFKLCNPSGSICYIMDAHFYEQNGKRSPITKRELDYLDVGHYLKGEVQEILGLAVLTKIA